MSDRAVTSSDGSLTAVGRWLTKLTHEFAEPDRPMAPAVRALLVGAAALALLLAAYAVHRRTRRLG